MVPMLLSIRILCALLYVTQAQDSHYLLSCSSSDTEINSILENISSTYEGTSTTKIRSNVKKEWNGLLFPLSFLSPAINGYV